MNPEIDELRPKLKEILYDCAVEIRCTKAAVYLFDGESLYELVTEYGFRSGGVPSVVNEDDVILDRCGRGRNAFLVNGLTTEPRFAERLYAAATDRLLAAPIYLRGKLCGFIDSRDKAAKQPFEQSDVPKIQKIAERMAALLVDKNIFGHRFITLSDEIAEHPMISTPVVSPAPTDEPPPVLGLPSGGPQAVAQAQPVANGAEAPPERVPTEPRPALRQQAPRAETPSLANLIMEAHASAARAMSAGVPESIGEVELAAAREVLRKILGINGAIVVSFTAFGHMGGVQEIASKGTVTGETLNFLQSKLSGWLAKRGEPAGSLRTSVQTPLGVSLPPLAPSHIQKVFTAPVAAGSLRSLYLTVGFGEAPDRTAHEALAMLLDEMQLVIDSSMSRAALQRLRLRVAEKLLEPEFTKYPELRKHTELVVARTEQFVRTLSLSPADAATVRLSSIVHDAGMRLLDYGRLYRKQGLSDDELAILREHVFVGAAMVEPLLGQEVARAVLQHHERMDGHGYPNELRGEEISLPARILAICDAYESMIEPNTYQPVESPEGALDAVARGAGSQFDRELAQKFIDMMRARTPMAASR